MTILYYSYVVVSVMILISGSSRGHKRRHSSTESEHDSSASKSSDNEIGEDEGETINEQFRRGKNLDHMNLEWGNNSENSVDPPDEMNDADWNMLGAALEKEFLK